MKHLCQKDLNLLSLGHQKEEKKLKSFKFKVKQITKRNTDSNLAKVIGKLNGLLRGFVNFFRVANCKRELVKLMGWVRRRLRCIQLRQWKKPSKLHRVLKQRGYKPPFKLIKMQSWRNSCSPLASHAMPNSWFHNELKLVDMSLVKTG